MIWKHQECSLKITISNFSCIFLNHNIFFQFEFFRYSKALRCTFLGERKNSCSSKLVQLLLLNRVKARWSKNRAAQGFHYINSFSTIFLDSIQKRAPARSVQLETVYLEALLYVHWNDYYNSKYELRTLISFLSWEGFNYQ